MLLLTWMSLQLQLQFKYLFIYFLYNLNHGHEVGLDLTWKCNNVTGLSYLVAHSKV